jgi:hypothetical protein
MLRGGPTNPFHVQQEITPNIMMILMMMNDGSSTCEAETGDWTMKYYYLGPLHCCLSLVCCGLSLHLFEVEGG